MTEHIFFQLQSTFILGLIYLAVFYRRHAKKHVKIVSTAIIWDILLILQIELSRGAIAKAAKPVANSALLNFHITIAVTTVLLYFTMFYLGRKLLKGNLAVKPLHKKLGWLTLSLRTITYITSFMVVTHP